MPANNSISAVDADYYLQSTFRDRSTFLLTEKAKVKPPISNIKTVFK